MVEQSTNVVHKQWIQKLGDFLLIRKVQCAVKRYPAGPRVSLNEGRKKYIPHKGTATYHTPLRCIGPIFTTCRTFSLFKIPSRLPRVIPATFNSLVPLIMWLSYKIQSLVSQKHKWGGGGYDVQTFSPSHAYSFCLNLKT